MNNKLLSGVLMIGIAATSFGSLSNANDNGESTKIKGNSEIRELMQKAKSGEELTENEKTNLEEAKSNFGKRGGNRGAKMGKRMGTSFLTDEEKTELEDMSDDEKKVFFEAKKAEREEQKSEHNEIITKLLNGAELTSEEQASLEERAEKLSSDDEKGCKNKGNSGKAIIAKLISGETLSADEEAELEEIKIKRAERQAKMLEIKALLEKKEAGEDLTEEEQTLLEGHQKNFGAKKGGMHKKLNKSDSE